MISLVSQQTPLSTPAAPGNNKTRPPRLVWFHLHRSRFAFPGLIFRFIDQIKYNDTAEDCLQFHAFVLETW